MIVSMACCFSLELHHALEDVPVLREEEVLRAKDLDCGIERVIIEQNRAENAAFGFEVLRERAFEGCIASHAYSLYIRPSRGPAQERCFSGSAIISSNCAIALDLRSWAGNATLIRFLFTRGAF